MNDPKSGLDSIAKTDLVVRIENACVAACTCVTKTPYYGAHKLDCRYRILQEASARIDRLERAIAAHNASMECGCDLNRRKDRCDPYLDRGRNCPDCPCDNRIILLDF